MAKSKGKKIRVRQVRSGIGTTTRTRETLKALGLRRPNQVVERNDTPETRGMIEKVSHLVEVID